MKNTLNTKALAGSLLIAAAYGVAASPNPNTLLLVSKTAPSCSTESATSACTDDDTAPIDLTATAIARAMANLSAINAGTTLVTALPTKMETKARGMQTFLNAIKLPYSNQLVSGNGTGVVVGMVDSGAQFDHPELKGQIIASYNVFTGGTDIADQMGHGTHVAGLIAGTLANGAILQGVASGTKLVVAKAFTIGAAKSTDIAKGIDWVVNVQKAPILSLSLGASVTALEPNIKNAVANGTLITAALGNDGKTSAAAWPAEFAKQPWANGQIIAVGAVDANLKRASFSNYDSTLANWTVYAPGVNVPSSYANSTMKSVYAYMSGTSMATPIVAGEAALIKSNWNFLSASDIAQVIFQSSTHLCSDTVTAAVCAARTVPDAVYGWGIVNVGAALQPIGALNAGTKSGTLIDFTGSLIATPKSGIAPGLKGVGMVAVDKFNRGFNVNIPMTVASTVKTASEPSTNPVVIRTPGGKFSGEYRTPDSSANPFGFGFGFGSVAGSETGGVAAGTTLGKFSYSFENDNGNSFGLGMGGSEKNFFGLDSTGTTPLNLSGEGSRFSAPYFGLAENATHMGFGMSLGDGYSVRLGAVIQSDNLTTPFNVPTGTSTAVNTSGKTIAAMEFQKNFKNFGEVGGSVAVVTLGQMLESNSLMGLGGNGAFAFGGGANTGFVTISGSTPVSAKATLSAMASLGQTAAYSNSVASIIDGTTASTSLAWSLGLAQKDVLRSGDSFGLTVSMPLRTMSGAMMVTTATSQSQEDGSLKYSTQSVSLAPSGQERDFELAYASAVTGYFGGQMTAVANLKLEPGHVAGAATQYGIGLRYTKVF